MISLLSMELFFGTILVVFYMSGKSGAIPFLSDLLLFRNQHLSTYTYTTTFSPAPLCPFSLHFVLLSQTKRPAFLLVSFCCLGWKIGLEPTTFGTTIRRSNRLSYIHRFAFALQRYGESSILQTKS